ncbi:MAG: regulatory iron-sulfur-containing complex subunit RicT [Candidatus Zixiibacteriota bacterium]
MEPQNLLYEIEFKAHRREFYSNPFSLPLQEQEWVIVEAERGEDMGFVHMLIGEETFVKGRPAKARPILRQANYDDRDKLAKNREMEAESLARCTELIAQHRLQMKLVDVEYQYDLNKMTYYFTADERVDFRALVKDLAASYRTRIELRQIGVRDEARRIGGFGICGLQQCCNTFIREFEPISTQLARDQGLSLNPAKISGNCGRLLCCLQYEQNHYADSMRKFPEVGSEIDGKQGRAVVEGINVFHQYMTVRYQDGLTEKLSWKEYNQILKKKQFVAAIKARSNSEK